MSQVDATKLDAFIAELEKSCPEDIRYSAREFVPEMMAPHDPLIHELVFSMFLWEASLSHAVRAMNALRDQLADINELRVCFPEEIASIIGTRYPQSQLRCERLIAALNTIFSREQELSLESLHEMPKRDARNYLIEIEGIPHFVAARITLIALGGHAFPLDGLLTKYLAQQGVLCGNANQDQHMVKIERAIRATDSRRVYGMVEYWADQKRNTSSSIAKDAPTDNPTESPT